MSFESLRLGGARGPERRYCRALLGVQLYDGKIRVQVPRSRQGEVFSACVANRGMAPCAP